MGVILDAISGGDLVTIVKTNISDAFDLTGKDLAAFFVEVKNRAAGKKISVLRIWGHGVTHYTDGTPYNKGSLEFGPDKLNNDTVGKFQPFLEVITPFFEQPSSRVELRGCQAAVGTGANMMLALANIWKAEVQGSDRSQPMMSWVPPVYSAKPGSSPLPVRRGEVPLPLATIIEYNDPRVKKP